MSGIETQSDGPVVTVTINRPPANAIDAATSRAMGDAFAAFRDNPDSRVALITGEGDRFFSAGWDLKSAAAGESYQSDYGVGGFGGFPELPGLNKPVIAAVNGLAVGGGFELVLAAHLVVAAETAEFFFGEIAAGVIPDAGTVLLPRMMPPAVALDLILTGRRLSAREAMRLGLVNRVVPAERLIEEARELAAELATQAPLAVEAVLAINRETSHLTVREALESMRSGSIPEYTRMLESEDSVEGPRAFAEGRTPEWKGR